MKTNHLLNLKTFSLFFIILMLILSYIPYIVSAEGTDYIENMDADLVGFEFVDFYYGAQWIGSENLAGTTGVTTSNPHSNTKSYRMLQGSQSLWTLENVSNDYHMRIWVKRAGAESSNLYFYFNNSNGDTIALMRNHNDGTGKFYFEFYEFGVGYNRIGSHTENTEYAYIELNITESDIADYTFKSSTGNVTESGALNEPQLNMTDCQIATVYVYNAGSSFDFYIDDIQLFFDYAGEGLEEEGTIPPCSPDSTIGSLGDSQFNEAFIKTYINTKYDIEITGYVHRLDFEIHREMVETFGSIATDFSAKINGYALGFASELIQLGDNDNYRLSWTALNLYINNTLISISIRNNNPIVPFMLPLTHADNMNDGFNHMSSYESSSYWNNHGEPYVISEYPTSYYHNKEPMIRLCFESDSTFEFNPNIQNDVESFASGQCTNSTQINIDWFLNTTAMAYINRLWIDTPSLAPYIARNITTQTGHIWFTPKETGTYYFNLSTDGVNHSFDSETITCSDVSNWLYVVPNPSGDTPFMIFYNYTGSTNGCIRIYDSEGNRVDSLNILQGTNSLSYQLNEHGVYYFRLCSISNIGGTTVYNQLFNYIHCVQGYIVNYIEVDTALGTDKTLEYTQTLISGEHSHLSKDVWIYIGASKFKSVSKDEHFAKVWIPDRQGEFLIKLVIELPSGKKVTLASTTVTVVDKDALISQPLLPKLDVMLGYLLGSIFVIVFILLPLLIMGVLGHTKQEIPSIVYMLTAGVGVVIVTGIGWWDFWASFFILAIGVIMIIVAYLMGKR